MLTFLPLAVYSLATWRLASLLCHEDGPAGVLRRLRQRTTFGGVLDCVWCCSVWVGAGWVLADALAPETAVRLAAVFALSAVAVMVERAMEVSYLVVKKGKRMAHKHNWMVYGTSIVAGCILVNCDCGALGRVDKPTAAEWAAAFHAPSEPYRWSDDSRIKADANADKANPA